MRPCARRGSQPCRTTTPLMSSAGCGPPSARPRAVRAVTTRRQPYGQVAAPDTGAGAGAPIRRDGADSGGEGLCRPGAAWMSVAGTDQPGSEARVAGSGHPTRNPRLAALFGRPVFHKRSGRASDRRGTDLARATRALGQAQGRKALRIDSGDSGIPRNSQSISCQAQNS